MCKKTNYKGPNTRIDKCMVHFIRNLSQCCEGKYEILACCCGHKRYPMTIVAKSRRGNIFEMVSNKDIPRTRKFYKRDKKGYYYIPEAQYGSRNAIDQRKRSLRISRSLLIKETQLKTKARIKS